MSVMKLYIGEDVLSERQLGENDMAHHGRSVFEDVMLCYGHVVFILVKFSLHGAMELCFFCHEIYRSFVDPCVALGNSFLLFW